MTQIAPRNNRRTPELKAKRDLAMSLYMTGLPVPVIAEQISVNLWTLKNWISRGKWIQTRKQAIETTKGRMQAGVLLHAARSLSEETRTDLAEVLSKQAKVLKSQPATKVSQLAGRDGLATAVKTVTDAASVIFGWSDTKVVGLVDIRQLSAEHNPPASVASPIIDVQSSQVPENAPEMHQSETSISVLPDAPVASVDSPPKPQV